MHASPHSLASSEKPKRTAARGINKQTIDSNVTAAGIFHLDRPAADEFLEVYQGILADIEYNATTMEMTSGRLLALELTQNNNGGNSKTDDSNVVTNFRNLCGPYPVHIAKKIRSDCLRAQYGNSQDKSHPSSTKWSFYK